MTKYTLSRVGLSVLVLALASVGRAADNPPQIATLGDNTYSVTVSASHKFTRDTGKLLTKATAAASEFCAKQGKQLKIVSVNEKKSMFLVGNMPAATVTFKALDLTDPELSRPAPFAAEEGKAATPDTNEVLYANLLRLDDLHKKGILNDEEFAAAKKKELERSR